MKSRLEKLKVRIIKWYSQCFYSEENMKYLGSFFYEKFKSPYSSFEHKRVSDEIQLALFNKKSTASVRYHAALILEKCMKTNNRFLVNYVEQNILEKYSKIAMITKKPKMEQTFFGESLEDPWGSLFFQKVIECLFKWQNKSLYFESIVKNLQKLKVGTDFNNSAILNPPSSLKIMKNNLFERVKMKILLFKETLYFIYQCFSLNKMEDEICNDLALSIELEREPLTKIEDSNELLNRINRLQQLLSHMKQDYTRGEPIQNYIQNYKKILARSLDFEEEKEDLKIQREYQQEFGDVKSENIIASLTSLTNLDFDIIPPPSKPIKSCLSFENPGENISHFKTEKDETPKKDSCKKKQLPLIYGKLKQLQYSAQSPMSFEYNTPDTKCNSMNQESPESNQNQISSLGKQIFFSSSFQYRTSPQINQILSSPSSDLSNSFSSSTSNSPLMFSTSQPFLFQRIYPSKLDSIMDEEPIDQNQLINKKAQLITSLNPTIDRKSSPSMNSMQIEPTSKIVSTQNPQINLQFIQQNPTLLFQNIISSSIQVPSNPGDVSPSNKYQIIQESVTNLQQQRKSYQNDPIYIQGNHSNSPQSQPNNIIQGSLNMQNSGNIISYQNGQQNQNLISFPYPNKTVIQSQQESSSLQNSHIIISSHLSQQHQQQTAPQNVLQSSKVIYQSHQQACIIQKSSQPQKIHQKFHIHKLNKNHTIITPIKQQAIQSSINSKNYVMNPHSSSLTCFPANGNIKQFN